MIKEKSLSGFFFYHSPVILLLVISMILIQSATNMINNYFDFKRGADINKSTDEKALVSGKITPKQVLIKIFLYQLIAFIASQAS